MEKATVIALMSVKNEAWMLKKSLTAAALWADVIIVGDHGSEDGSAAIAQAHPKVQFIDLQHIKGFDEYERRQQLLDAARKIKAKKRILVSIDADEMLSANILDSPEWDTVLQAPIGSKFHLDLVNIHPDRRRYWQVPNFYRIFIDDNSPYEAGKIHIPHLPEPSSRPFLKLTNVKILHFQFIETDRYRCKQDWYLCWEILNRPHYHPVHLYRFYHQKQSVWRYQKLPAAWTQAYEVAGIDWRHVDIVQPYYWAAPIQSMIATHGASAFKWLPVWSDSRFRDSYNQGQDPRSWGLKILHFYLKITQKMVWLPYRLNRPILYIDILIILFLRYFIGFDPEPEGSRTRFFSQWR